MIGIGSPVWVFDINRRVYPANKGLGQGPIWREHWRAEQVVSETTRSWITNSRRKIPKRGLTPGVCFNQEEIDRAAYVHENKYTISERVRRIDDYDTLRKIADILERSQP